MKKLVARFLFRTQGTRATFNSGPRYNGSPPGPRRPPESSPPSPGGSSSTSGHRASRLSAGAALSRAVFVACCTAVTFLAASAALLALPLQAEAQTTGICGRTPAVRTAILAKISGVSNCADVTDAHLAAITGSLPLGNGITTALATEDFAGLTALTILYLNGTGLTTLPDNVFDDLIALQILSLQDNELTALPDGVFEPLTALIFGSLSGNPGAPFAPEVDALPDDGTVPIAGGTVTLDGSDGGPWGTNVTYSWRQTSGPASGVTFDDAASATPVVTIPALAVGTELAFTLTVNGRGNMEGTASDTDIATVAATDTTNTPASGTPAITGTPQVGEVLHVGTSGIIDTDGLTNVSYRYQWLRVNSDGASNETRIGSNADTYTLVNDDEGKRIRVRVRFTDDAANPETLISAATGAVAPFPTSSICGRTAEVRNELLYLIEDNEGTAVACSDVTDDHLAAITGDLTVVSNGITALAAGDFAGLTSLTELHLYDNDLSTLPDVVFEPLTSLTELYLFDNDLSTLPAGVFTGLTSLTILDLADNALSTLPAGVFTGLTSLTELYLDANDLTALPAGVFTGLTSLTIVDLNGNELTTLPDGVFEPLTSLTELNLTDNTGAPFAPEADALPDDGTVPIAGGMVTLDGNGSDGGPWGTNLTYGWALTNPASGVTVTFDDAASATPVVTIPALAAASELTFTLAVTGRGGTDGIAPATDTAKFTATDANAAPTFTSAAAFDAAENQTGVGTLVASDGDTDDSVTGYAIQGGADASKFSVVEATGVLTFASAPNFEDAADADADNAYVVVVRASSGTGARLKTADQTITVTVTDVAGEAPGVPAAPSVTSASVTSVTAAWAAPANGGPPITDYDYRYRVKTPQGPWTEVTGTPITALSATIAGLAEGTEYDVQVRATNDEGTSNWSESGSGSTDANAAPAFTSAAAFDAAENQTGVGTVVASDGDTDDSVTGYAIQGGADASKFSVVEVTGVLTFVSEPNFEDVADADADNAYVVVVRATSGTGARLKTADQTITVTVTDVAGEAPGVPAAPSVTSASVTSVTAAWAAPANGGPPITDYDYRYRVKTPQGPWTEVTGTPITALSATIAGLAEDTEYEVQVRATNDEGTSGWSASGSGSTDANAAPTFTSAAAFDAAENQTAVGTVVASDDNAGDNVTGYAIQGGADASTFSIVPSTGVLTFAAAPNFEAPADADTDNGYVVVVRVTSGTGAREKTADQTITVTVTDVDSEVPGVPAVPTVSAASESSVMASWTAPATAGPAITDYDYRYRVKAPQGPWTEVTNTAVTGLSAMIAGLAEDTEYEVQVRATNDEGTSGWSASGSGSTNANNSAANNSAATGKPAITGTARVARTLTATKGTIADVDGTTKADNGDSGYAYTYQWIRVDGGTETNISGATSNTYTPVDDEGKKIKVRVSFQDDADHSESRTSAATATVTGNGNETALSIADASAAENERHFLFEVTLSRSSRNVVKVDFETISGGTATEGVDYHARRIYTHVIPPGETTVQMGFALIEDTVDDAGETVKVRLSNARRVNAYGDKIKDLDITTAEATGTINAPPTTTTNVPGLTIRIQDATGSEDSRWLDFKVELSRKYDDYVCYDFETISGGTATEGTDYLKLPKAQYWMQIGAKTGKPFVRIIDDSVNDNGETVKVKISNARLCNDASQTVSITRAEATGTIRNSDPLPRALMARFGRTAAVHVVEQVEERIRARRTPGMSARLAGRELRPGMTDDVSRGLLRQLGSLARSKAPVEEGNNSMAGFPGGAVSLRTTGRTGVTPIGVDPHREATGPNWIGYLKRGFGVGDLLTGSSFELNRETGRSGMLSFWSRGARSQFTGREDRVTLDGRTATTMAGADYRKGRLVAGLSLAHSRGQGDYKGVDVGALASSVTGLYPWLGYQATDRITVWGVTGIREGLAATDARYGWSAGDGIVYGDGSNWNARRAGGPCDGRLRDGLQDGCIMGGNLERRFGGSGGQPRGDTGGGDPAEGGAGGLARL